MGLPLGRGPWGRLFHHSVDLLERETLGFGYEEVGIDEGGGTETAPDEEDAGSQVGVSLVLADHVRCNDGNDLRVTRTNQFRRDEKKGGEVEKRKGRPV